MGKQLAFSFCSREPATRPGDSASPASSLLFRPYFKEIPKASFQHSALVGRLLRLMDASRGPDIRPKGKRSKMVHVSEIGEESQGGHKPKRAA